MLISKKALFTLIIFSFFNSAYAIETHSKIWLAPIFTGSLSADKKVKFYLEPNVRLIDDKYKFQQALLWMGLGYQLSPRLVLFAGDTPMTDRNLNGTYTHQNIVWQQANWLVLDCTKFTYDSRSRLEEVKRDHESQWAIDFRERLQLKFPLTNWEKHALVVSDEVFFNLKGPTWTRSNSFILQNRAYVGIETQLSKEASFSVGYLNQYLFTFTNQMSHVLVVGSEVNFG